MQIMIGFSGEVSPGQWRKADITLDETDFYKLMVEYECVPANVTTTQMFTVLELECQRLITAELIMRSKNPDQKLLDEWKSALKDFTSKRNDAIQKLKASE